MVSNISAIQKLIEGKEACIEKLTETSQSHARKEIYLLQKKVGKMLLLPAQNPIYFSQAFNRHSCILCGLPSQLNFIGQNQDKISIVFAVLRRSVLRVAQPISAA